jgi:eukaryotic translation initiation factor 2C
LKTCFGFLKVKIIPEVSSSKTRKAVISELVRLHRNTDLAKRLPAYDGGRNLYTAGLLPFTYKEFSVILSDDDYVTGGIR